LCWAKQEVELTLQLQLHSHGLLTNLRSSPYVSYTLVTSAERLVCQLKARPAFQSTIVIVSADVNDPPSLAEEKNFNSKASRSWPTF
jgi:hypothetical protein